MYVKPEEMQVPQNVREEFKISEINTEMNDVEEVHKENYYVDGVYVPEADPRAINVVEKIAKGVPYHAVKDDKVSQEQMEKYVAKAIAENA